MIKSMTGYGRQEKLVGTRKILAEVKSVNHRFADYSIKLPRHMMFLDEKVRALAAEYITRGKVDIYISVENYADNTADIILNEALAASYIKALETLRDKFSLADDISVSSVARNTELFITERVSEDEDEVWEAVSVVLREAFEAFCSMREREGARICSDLRKRVEYMQSIARKIDERAPEVVADYEKRLYDKIKETLGDRNIDDARVLTEVAVFADKAAINEETVRLASHFDEYFEILDSGKPAGRRLDFLVQEMNREINTIGSKANDLAISKMVVELKGELEKIREQIQNIE